MKIINVFEAKTRLSELLELVGTGQEVIIGKYGKPVAILLPYKKNTKKRKLGQLKGQSLKGKYKMSEDFNDPLPAEYFVS